MKLFNFFFSQLKGLKRLWALLLFKISPNGTRIILLQFICCSSALSDRNTALKAGSEPEKLEFLPAASWKEEAQISHYPSEPAEFQFHQSFQCLCWGMEVSVQFLNFWAIQAAQFPSQGLSPRFPSSFCAPLLHFPWIFLWLGAILGASDTEPDLAAELPKNLEGACSSRYSHETIKQFRAPESWLGNHESFAWQEFLLFLYQRADLGLRAIAIMVYMKVTLLLSSVFIIFLKCTLWEEVQQNTKFSTQALSSVTSGPAAFNCARMGWNISPVLRLNWNYCTLGVLFFNIFMYWASSWAFHSQECFFWESFKQLHNS